MKLAEITDLLAERLKQALPGELSHKKMLARTSGGGRILFKKTDKTRKGAVLILLYNNRKGIPCFALIQRPDYNGTHGGQVSFPGGRQEPEDKDLYHTALRETEEEIGADRRRVQVLGHISEYFVGASNHLVLPVVGFLTEIPTFVPDDYEVAEVLEIPLEHLLDSSREKRKVLTVGPDKVKLNAPYFDLAGRVVWGATAGILSEFRDILTELEIT